MAIENKALENLLASTVGATFDATAAQFPDREAAVIPELGVRLTYRAIQQQASEVAKGLIALGVTKGEHVALWSPNRAEWCQTAHAIWKIGAVVVTVNTLFRPPEFSYVLGLSETTTLVMAPGFRDLDYVGTLYQLDSRIERCQAGRIQSAVFPCLKRIVLLDDEPRPGMFSFPQLVQMAGSIGDEALEARRRAVKPEDPAVMIFTSGTTGFPKGSVLRHRSVLAEAHFSGEKMGLRPGDRCLFPLPYFTIGGMQTGMMMPVCYSMTAVGLPWFDASKALQLIQDEKITLAIMVNTMWVATLDLPEFGTFDLSSLTRGFSAGAPCPIAMMREIERRYAITMTIGYGLSETSAVVVATDIADPDDKRLATVGRTLPGVEAKVIDHATGDVLPFGEQGEICLRGWCNMIGYYNRPDATAEAVDRQGWLHTGDVGLIDREGYLRITGRMKDVIIRGGQNVSAKEIEDLLHTHPDIAEAYVVGVPSRKYGEEVLAAIKLRAGRQMTEIEVREFCNANIARYKVPRHVWFVDSFPMNPMGKTQKFKLIEMGVAHFKLEGEKQGPTA